MKRIQTQQEEIHGRLKREGKLNFWMEKRRQRVGKRGISNLDSLD